MGMTRICGIAGASWLLACGGGGAATEGATEATTTSTTETASSSGSTSDAPPPMTSTTTTTSTSEAPTTGDASTSEATTTTGDASTGTTGAPVSCPPGFYCEDFESFAVGEVPGAPWQVDGGGAALIEAGMAVSGAQAVHLTTGSGYGGRATLRLAVPEVFPTTHLFGRMRMWLDEASPDGVHWTMIEASGPTEALDVWPEPFVAALRYGGQHQKRLMANYETPGYYSQTGPGSDCWHHSQRPIPEKAWACMEWEFDSDAQQMRFWLDGEEVADLAVGSMGQGCGTHDTDDIWYYPLMESLVLGWIDYQDGGGRELWIDDVAVGPARVGCD